jgi:hypothetical protein
MCVEGVWKGVDWVWKACGMGVKRVWNMRGRGMGVESGLERCGMCAEGCGMRAEGSGKVWIGCGSGAD